MGSLHAWGLHVLENVPDASSTPNGVEMAQVVNTSGLVRGTFGRYTVSAVLDSKCFIALGPLTELLNIRDDEGVYMPKSWESLLNLGKG